jgi:endonuclease/exonuclease/phosphatase family metal-dependent hydrolase
MEVDMKALRIPLMVAAVVLFGACQDERVSSPDLRPEGAVQRGIPGGAMQGGISVLSWNVYVGTDVDAVIFALADGYDPAADGPILEAQIGTLLATDFPTRAAAIVDEIADRAPHVVGLQEITTLHLEAFGIPTIDFLDTLQLKLAEQGLNYVVAGQILNIDVSLDLMPGVTIGMQDYDVMLVDAKRVSVQEAWGKRFDYNIGPVAPGIDLYRGYVFANIKIGGKDYSVVSAHLESSGPEEVLPELRGAQAMEIATVLAGAERAVVMGDLNDEIPSPMNYVFANAGFIDAWTELHPGTDGYTCCHALTLDEEIPDFYERIDYVFVRGIDHPVSGLHGSIEILGEDPEDRIMDAPYYPLWPSDHAGLTARFFVPIAEDLR